MKIRTNTEQQLLSQEWEAEATALDEISDLNDPHIIQRIAAITIGRKRYFMFQWADGGNLREFWHREPRPRLDASFVKEIFLQLRGLAGALSALHNYKDEGSYRHGDLKPENILRFNNGSQVGVLKIADMGLARHHTVATHLRPPTSTRYGTVRYEPPEVFTAKLSQEGRSRLWDVWSMGCITLEFIVWMIYGYKELQDFNEGLKGPLQDPSPYWRVEEEGGSKVAKVHPRVTTYMDRIAKEPQCLGPSAIGDLLEIVRTKLLVVALSKRTNTFMNPGTRQLDSINNRFEKNGPPVLEVTQDGVPESLQSPSPRGPFRAKAEDLCSALDNILGKADKDDRYWLTDANRDGIGGRTITSGVVSHNDLLSPASARRQGPLADRRKSPRPAEPQGYLAPNKLPDVSRSPCRPLSLVRLPMLI